MNLRKATSTSPRNAPIEMIVATIDQKSDHPASL
jgi:hypothetical protein